MLLLRLLPLLFIVLLLLILPLLPVLLLLVKVPLLQLLQYFFTLVGRLFSVPYASIFSGLFRTWVWENIRKPWRSGEARVLCSTTGRSGDETECRETWSIPGGEIGFDIAKAFQRGCLVVESVSLFAVYTVLLFHRWP